MKLYTNKLGSDFEHPAISGCLFIFSFLIISWVLEPYLFRSAQHCVKLRIVVLIRPYGIPRVCNHNDDHWSRRCSTIESIIVIFRLGFRMPGSFCLAKHQEIRRERTLSMREREHVLHSSSRLIKLLIHF